MLPASQVTAPYAIKNVKGLKVAIIGMGNVSTLTSLTEGGNSIQATPFEQNEAARAYVDLLRPLVDLVVIVSHLGLTEDQSIVQGYEILSPLRRYDQTFVKRCLPRSASSFLIAAGARTLDQNSAHHLRRNGEKMSPVLPLDLLAVNEPDIGFVDEAGCLQSVTRLLPGHVAAGEPAQRLVHERDEFVQCRRITPPPGQEQLRYRMR